MVSGKHVLFKCVNDGTNEGRSRGSVPMWKGLSLEGEIVRYPSVSLSSSLSRSEKVEQLAVQMRVVRGGVYQCGRDSHLRGRLLGIQV